MAEKTHDWLATLAFNQDLSLAMLNQAGITPDNASLLSAEEYKKNEEVRKLDIFQKDDNSGFDEEKFDKFYKSASDAYLYAASDLFDNNVINEFSNLTDAFWRGERYDRSLVNIDNKTPLTEDYSKHLFGTIDFAPDMQMSAREIGQTQHVIDSVTGEDLGFTPNEMGAFKTAFAKETLVLATYDQDEDEILDDGRVVHHKKGDFKLNKSGKTQYETLGNRSVAGKEVLRAFDVLTVDGSKWNTIDIFDHDDIKQSALKTAFSTIAKVAPAFIPGVDLVYGVIGIAKSLNELMPKLGKAIDGFALNTTDNTFGRAMNKWDAFAQRFAETESDYAKQHFVSFEGFGNMIGSTFGQLVQQKTLAKIPQFLNMGGSAIRNAELGKSLALAYMAGTSSVNTYDDFIAAGANERTAGIAMFANIAALYGLMNTDYFRDTFFKGSWFDESVVREPARANAFKWKEVLGGKNITEASSPKEARNLFKTLNNWYHNSLVPGLTSSELLNRSFGEATEEVMEEAVTDVIKSFTLGLNAMGIPCAENELDFGYSVQEVVGRYAQSFAGGFVGGALFYGHGKYEQALHERSIKRAGGDVSLLKRDDIAKLTYAVANGQYDEIKSYYDKWYKKGLCGSVNLNIYGKPIQNGELSQNDAVYNKLIEELNVINDQVKSEGILISERALDEMFERGYNGDWHRIETRDEAAQYLRAAQVVALGSHSNFKNAVYNTLTDIIDTQRRIDAIEQNELPADDATTAQKDAAKQRLAENKEYQKLKQKLTELKEFKDRLFNGGETDYFVNQGLFASQNDFESRLPKGYNGTTTPFVNVNKDDYCIARFGTVYDKLNNNDKLLADVGYDAYEQTEAREQKFKGYDLYLAASKRLGPNVQNACGNGPLKGDRFHIKQSGLEQRMQVIESLPFVNDRINALVAKSETDEGLTSEEEQELFELNNSRAEMVKLLEVSPEALQYNAISSEASSGLEAAMKAIQDLSERIGPSLKDVDDLVNAKSKALESVTSYESLDETTKNEVWNELDPNYLVILQNRIKSLNDRLNELNEFPDDDYILNEKANISAEIATLTHILETPKATDWTKEERGLVANTIDAEKRRIIPEAIKNKITAQYDEKIATAKATLQEAITNYREQLAGLISETIEIYREAAENNQLVEDGYELFVIDSALQQLTAIANHVIGRRDTVLYGVRNLLTAACKSNNLTEQETASVNGILDALNAVLNNIDKKNTAEYVKAYQILKSRLDGFENLNKFPFIKDFILGDRANAINGFVEAYNKALAENSSDVANYYQPFADALTQNKILDRIDISETPIENSDKTQKTISVVDGLGEILPTFGNTAIIESLQNLLELRDQIPVSPIFDILRAVTVEIEGETMGIVDLLEKEMKHLVSLADIEEYVIHNQATIDALNVPKTMQYAIQVTSSIIQGAGNGFNALLNNSKRIREKYGDFVELDEVTANTLLSDLASIQNKLQALNMLHEENSKASLRVQKDITMVCRPRWIKSLISMSDNDKKTFGVDANGQPLIDFNQLFVEAGGDEKMLENLNEQTYIEYEPVFRAFEQKIYEAFAKHPELVDQNGQDLPRKGQRLARMCALYAGPKAWVRTSTLLDKNPDTQVERTDLADYIISCATISAEKHYANHKRVLDSDQYELAPVYGQEFANRMALSSMLGVETYNAFLYYINHDNWSSVDKAIGIEKSTESHVDISNDEAKKQHEHIPILYNLRVVIGGAGVGKSTGVAGTFLEEVAPLGAEVILVAPKQTQVDNLRAGTKSKDSVKGFTLGALFNQLFGVIPGKNATLNEAKIPWEDVPKDLSKTVFSSNTNSPKIMVIDEIGKMNAIELAWITQWAKANNVFILGLGDDIQEAAFVSEKANKSDEQPKLVSSGLEDCAYMRAPELTATMRAGCAAKVDNYISFRSILVPTRDAFYKHPEWSVKPLNEQFAKNNKLVLKYYENGDKTVLYGDKVITNLDNEERVSTALEYARRFAKNYNDVSEKKPIAIITDDPATYQAVLTSADTQIEIVNRADLVNIENAQGGEWDYVIVDSEFCKRANDNQFAAIRSVYTMSQRAAKGTVIFEDAGETKWTSFVQLSGNDMSDPSYATIIQKDPEKLKEYKRWTLTSYENMESLSEEDSKAWLEEAWSKSIKNSKKAAGNPPVIIEPTTDPDVPGDPNPQTPSNDGNGTSDPDPVVAATNEQPAVAATQSDPTVAQPGEPSVNTPIEPIVDPISVPSSIDNVTNPAIKSNIVFLAHRLYSDAFIASERNSSESLWHYLYGDNNGDEKQYRQFVYDLGGTIRIASLVDQRTRVLDEIFEENSYKNDELKKLLSTIPVVYAKQENIGRGKSVYMIYAKYTLNGKSVTIPVLQFDSKFGKEGIINPEISKNGKQYRYFKFNQGIHYDKNYDEKVVMPLVAFQEAHPFMRINIFDGTAVATVIDGVNYGENDEFMRRNNGKMFLATTTERGMVGLSKFGAWAKPSKNQNWECAYTHKDRIGLFGLQHVISLQELIDFYKNYTDQVSELGGNVGVLIEEYELHQNDNISDNKSLISDTSAPKSLVDLYINRARQILTKSQISRLIADLWNVNADGILTGLTDYLNNANVNCDDNHKAYIKYIIDDGGYMQVGTEWYTINKQGSPISKCDEPTMTHVDKIVLGARVIKTQDNGRTDIHFYDACPNLIGAYALAGINLEAGDPTKNIQQYKFGIYTNVVGLTGVSNGNDYYLPIRQESDYLTIDNAHFVVTTYNGNIYYEQYEMINDVVPFTGNEDTKKPEVPKPNPLEVFISSNLSKLNNVLFDGNLSIDEYNQKVMEHSTSSDFNKIVKTADGYTTEKGNPEDWYKYKLGLNPDASIRLEADILNYQLIFVSSYGDSSIHSPENGEYRMLYNIGGQNGSQQWMYQTITPEVANSMKAVIDYISDSDVPDNVFDLVNNFIYATLTNDEIGIENYINWARTSNDVELKNQINTYLMNLANNC